MIRYAGIVLWLLISAIAIFSKTFASVSTSIQHQQTEFIHFLTLADIHFDPFLSCHAKPCPLIEKLRSTSSNQWATILSEYDTSPPQYKLDTNNMLLNSAMIASQKAAAVNQAQFVLVLGDFLGHEFRSSYKKYSTDERMAGYQSFVRKTMEFITHQLAHAFPSIDVYSVVGNNDSYQDDYVTNPGGQFFQDTAKLWSSLIKNKFNRVAMQSQFSFSGYYAITLPSQYNLRLIVINTNLFSNKANGQVIDEVAAKQLKWLHEQLQIAKDNKQKVFIAMHIPDGIDVYMTFRIRLFRLIELWKSQYTKQFQVELQQFSPEIAGVFVGHLHSDWLQIETFNSNEIPVMGIPSISPIFGNNPGFKLYSYSSNPVQLDDFTTYYDPLNGKKVWIFEYDFNQVYQHNCYHCPIVQQINMLQRRDTLADYYQAYYGIGKKSERHP